MGNESPIHLAQKIRRSLCPSPRNPQALSATSAFPSAKKVSRNASESAEARFMVQWDHDSSRWDVFLIEAEDGPCEDTMADLVTSAAYLWMTHAIELAPRGYPPSI